jgi:hypothetical protein
LVLTALTALSLIGWGEVAAQGLEQALAGVTNGKTAFRYPIREGVEVCEHGIRIEGSWRSSRGRHSGRERCSTERAEIVFELRDGAVHDLELLPAGAGLAVDNDLGFRSAEEAVSFLISLARQSPRRRVAESALVPVVIALDVESWPALLDIARDDSRHRGVRERAVFWIGQEVAEIAARGVIDDGSTAEADEVREAAVFALSQRAPEESIPVLMELAQVSAHPEVRRSAVFWLSQSGEGRVLEFFERVLEGA